MINSPEPTLEEMLIERYRQWISSGTWNYAYWKNKGHWRSEIEGKINELKKKIKN